MAVNVLRRNVLSKGWMKLKNMIVYRATLMSTSKALFQNLGRNLDKIKCRLF